MRPPAIVATVYGEEPAMLILHSAYAKHLRPEATVRVSSTILSYAFCITHPRSEGLVCNGQPPPPSTHRLGLTGWLQHCNTNRYYSKTNLSLAYSFMDRKAAGRCRLMFRPAYEPQAPQHRMYHRLCSLCITLHSNEFL